jgi:hypothetical protein
MSFIPVRELCALAVGEVLAVMNVEKNPMPAR